VGMPTIYVVSGSRSLADTPWGESWVCQTLRSIFSPTDVLMTGYAEGPDRWSLHIANDLGMPWYSYHQSGNINVSNGTVRSWCKGRRDPPSGMDPHWKWKEWFLFRDSVLVEHAAKFARKGLTVEVLGFVDPNSPTQGTAATLTMSEKNNLKVNRVPLPAAHALTLPDPDLMYKAVLEHNRQLQNGVESPDDFAIISEIRRQGNTPG